MLKQILVEVDGVPPGNVHLIESKTPPLAVVDVLVNVKLPPIHTTVSLAVKLAVTVGVVEQEAGKLNAAV